jgi:hypothetical protein
VVLNPQPTYPEYPDRFPYTVQETSGGASVRQRAKKQPKEMRWVWADYKPTVPLYENLYWWLFRQQAHIRVADAKNAFMYLKEDVTTNFGTWSSGTGKIEPAYIRVIITYVGRKEDQAGGKVSYTETEVRFVIADDTITNQF